MTLTGDIHLSHSYPEEETMFATDLKLQIPLELIKDGLASVMREFCDFTRTTSLQEILLQSLSFKFKHPKLPTSMIERKESVNKFMSQVEYIRQLLALLKLLPSRIVSEMGWKTLRDCGNLLKESFDMIKNDFEHGGNANDDKNVCSDIAQCFVLPALQLMDDCVDINSDLFSEHANKPEDFIENVLKYVGLILQDAIKFLVTPVGLLLSKSDFARILSLCKKLWNFKESLSASLDLDKPTSLFDEADTVEKDLSRNIPQMLGNENGRIFMKFWCEIYSSRKLVPKFFENVTFQQTTEEVYMIFTVFMGDAFFWNTGTGKAVTPVLIQAIRQDLQNGKSETKKRAAFVLQGITTLYSEGKPLFDPSIPEVSTVSLNSLDRGKYSKFWSHFFDLYEILNETQVHIIQPILHKLNIFHEFSDCKDVLLWLPILIVKMTSHDNRTVVKEGLERFLLTGQYLQDQNSPAINEFRCVAENFLDMNIMPLLKDHVGWVLKEPEEFFKMTLAFGKFLVHLYSNGELPLFIAADKILTFLTSSGKCMSSNTVFFFISALDEIFSLHANEMDSTMGNLTNDLRSKIESSITLLALLLSISLTTVSKYFRELLDKRCVNILYKLSPFMKEHFHSTNLTSTVFLKLLTFLGSISEKTFTATETQNKLVQIVYTVSNENENISKELLTEHKLYDFARDNLSSTSITGAFRFLIIILKTNAEMISSVSASVTNFSLQCVRQEILPGSIQGLHEFFQHCYITEIPSVHVAIVKEICVALEKPSPISFEDFKSVTVRLEVLNTLPEALLKHYLTMRLSTIKKIEYQNEDVLRAHILRKIYTISESETIQKFLRLEDFNSQGLENLGKIEDISKFYYSCTDRNLRADFYLVKFDVYRTIVGEQIQMEESQVLDILRTVLDAVEKCDPTGVAAGILLAKSVLKFIKNDNVEGEMFAVLESIASVGWSLAFELRKSDVFWLEIDAFIQFIACTHFLKTGTLHKFADLIFEHGETVSGLLLLFVTHLVEVNFADEFLEDVHNILMKAALSGGPLPKNNRVGFAIWNYLCTKDGTFSDPENFSADCKARILACERLRINFHRLRLIESEQRRADMLLYKIVTQLLQQNDQISLTKKRYFGGSETHRIKQRIFQLILILQPYFKYEISKIALHKTCCSLASDSPQPSVRYLGEWLVTKILARHPELHKIFFSNLDERVQTRIGFGAFFATICLQVSKILKSEEFYDKALQSLTVLTLSQHVTVRIYAQIAFQRIFETALEYNFESIVKKYSIVLASLKRALTSVSGNCSKLLENVSQDFYVNTFHCETHYSHDVIFTLLPRISGMIKDECILHPKVIKGFLLTPQSEDIILNFKVKKNLEKLYVEHEGSAWHLKSVVADGRELGEELPEENVCLQRKTNSHVNAPAQELNYQKKINPWKLLEAVAEDYGSHNLKKRVIAEDGLVVVASLLDHMPNLGGLCRTCEIFGVQKYVVNSIKVVNDQQFQNLSVSAQNWVNILEVPVRDLESFLLTYAAKGFTILGVEQANESSSLKNFTFPEKSVLLLGNEKYGIPTDLLHLVDKCIEIPQVGIIRSLNVHVTGALCIYQYFSQHML